MPPHVLLVIGVHREELAFGAAVAQGLDRSCIDVLHIPDGLSGHRPRADQRFHYDTLHRALYRQLPPQVQEHHELLIDLHTGLDPQGPCADLYCCDIQRLESQLAHVPNYTDRVRLIPLGQVNTEPGAATVIPAEIWHNPRFVYVGLEIYLPDSGAGRAEDHAFARMLIEALAKPC